MDKTMIKYSEQLTKTTCVLCGAPINAGENCLYCGSLYVPDNEEFYEPDITISPFFISISTTREISYMNGYIFNNDITFKTCYNDNEAKNIKRIFKDQIDRLKNHDIIFHYKNKEILVEGVFITSLNESLNNKIKYIEATLRYDTIKIKKKEEDK